MHHGIGVVEHDQLHSHTLVVQKSQSSQIPGVFAQSQVRSLFTSNTSSHPLTGSAPGRLGSQVGVVHMSPSRLRHSESSGVCSHTPSAHTSVVHAYASGSHTLSVHTLPSSQSTGAPASHVQALHTSSPSQKIPLSQEVMPIVKVSEAAPQLFASEILAVYVPSSRFVKFPLLDVVVPIV